MSNQDLHEKSKERVKELGEVYTPAHIAREMISMIAVDMDTVFFEPTCGNGNIVMEMIEKLLEVYSDQCPSVKVDLVINNLWAIDIDEENVKECRARVYKRLTDVIKTQEDWAELGKILLARIIQNRIDQNDMLAALILDPNEAYKAAQKTKMSRKFWDEVGHKPMPFLNGKDQLKKVG